MRKVPVSCSSSDLAVCCLSSGQGSAGQAAGAQSQRDPAEDLQRDDRLGGVGHASQTLSALTGALSHLLICVSACLPACFHPLPFDWAYSFFLITRPFPIITLFSSRVVGLLTPSFRSLWLKSLLPSLSAHFLLRCWGPLGEHVGADQRPTSVLLLGCRQETLLHRQRWHGLEISGHCTSDTPACHNAL